MKRERAERKPKQPSALEGALRLLSVRSRAEGELRLALARRSHAPEEVESAFDELRRLGYLDDSRFARERASSLLRGGRLGERAILQKLAAHGLSAGLARAALADVRAEVGFDPCEAARSLLVRRGLLGRPLAPKERAKAFRFLLGRGFAPAVVEQVLRSAGLSMEGEGE